MVETTLKHRCRVGFALNVHAVGLAATVRVHGGAYTRSKWLNVEVLAGVWAKGLPVALHDQGMVQDTRDDKNLKATHLYQSKGKPSRSSSLFIVGRTTPRSLWICFAVVLISAGAFAAWRASLMDW